MTNYEVSAIGNAVVDFICHVNDDTLIRLNLRKGDMHFTEKQPVEPWNLPKSPGGSSANVITGLANLGLSTFFSSALSNDKTGNYFRKSMESLGVDTYFAFKNGDTASIIVFITPDGERTFSVSRGIMHEYRKKDLPLEMIEDSKIFHTSCYKLNAIPMKASVMKAIKFAKESNVKVSLDLAYPNFVEENKIFLEEFIRNDVDIVFANDQEMEAFGKPLERLADIVVYKLGEKGSVVVSGSKRIKIDAYKTKVVNTNGAGDGYAAGFLYGLSKELDLETCGRIGAYYAGKIVGQDSARVKEKIKSIENLI